MMNAVLFVLSKPNDSLSLGLYKTNNTASINVFNFHLADGKLEQLLLMD